MTKTVHLSHEYRTTPDRLWSIATDWDCLRESMKGVVTFYGLPDEPLDVGQTIETEVSILGILPRMPWTMKIVSFDRANRTFTSRELGGAVKMWKHTLRVHSTEIGATLTDTIEIDAGRLTSIYCLWAHFMYRRRHRPRLKILSKDA